MPNEKLNSIDSAIEELEQYIRKNRASGRGIMIYLQVSTFLILLTISYILFNYKNIELTFGYILVGVLIMVFAISMSIYRFHLNEIARAEHYKVGFMRIRVAANNYDKEGFHTEVREALTDKAFDFSTSSFFSSKKVESPIPGHPTSDLSAKILNKLLESIEVGVKKKQ